MVLKLFLHSRTQVASIYPASRFWRAQTHFAYLLNNAIFLLHALCKQQVFSQPLSRRLSDVEADDKVEKRATPCARPSNQASR
jgi:hypothetical protein